MTHPAAPRVNPGSKHRLADTLARWPADQPLGALISADPAGRTRSSLLARPSEIRTLRSLDELRTLIRTNESCIQPASAQPPGWLVAIDFGIGHQIEPAAGGCIQHSPAITLARVDDAYIIDNRTGSTTTMGSPPPLTDAPSEPSLTLGPVQGLERQTAYTEAVRCVVELIRAGDAFQVNLTHALSAPMSGSARTLAAQLITALSPWHGFYLEQPSESAHDIGAIASMSPELFLEMNTDRLVRTRPMKGTRPGSLPKARLELAPKDQAELAMIVDLMRNDLGRVARVGSVRVTQPRDIEPHGGSPDAPALWQGVATIEAHLRPALDAVDLLRAAFPPGSVTGAPKVRAMQIIDELEPELGMTGPLTRRGPYCGAQGYLADDGSLSLNVAIRTAIVTGPSDGLGNFAQGTAHYPVGAGIVADSDPELEWRETLDKARAFIDLTASRRAGGGVPVKD